MSHDPDGNLNHHGFSALDLGLDDLPVDVFDVHASGLTVESLTGGHGMTEIGASTIHIPFCSCCPCVAEN